VYSRESIQRELAVSPSPFDIKRREFLAKLHEATGRNVIVYAMKPPLGAIWVDDLQGFMAAQHELKGDQLDLIIHSTGGSSEAAEQIVSYLRQKYKHIRVIVPLYAMSAATMIACAADEILMGRQSALGPIDPQFLTPAGPMPAHAIIHEFQIALEQIKVEPKTAAFWVPKLSVLPHGYYSLAKISIERAKGLVGDWLRQHMKLDQDKANQIADWLASSEHGSHGKPISITEALTHELNIKALEQDQNLQDLVLAVFHSTMLTFEGTPCLKFVENHLGRGFFQMMQPQMAIGPRQAPPPSV
jgi:hypothetical protein